MAEIGQKLKLILKYTNQVLKDTIISHVSQFATPSSVSSVIPVLIVILNVVLMEYVLKFDRLGIVERELFSCTVLYIFIFALLTSAPFNYVLSRYLSDVIFEERYEDIRPCFFLGLSMNIVLSSLIGIPFCLWEHFVGKVDVFYTFTGYCGYISLVLVFYGMLYLNLARDYHSMSLFYILGMLSAFLLAVFLRVAAQWGIRESMLFGLMVGFFLIAVLELALISSYFPKSSNRFKPVLLYFKKYWQLSWSNFFYVLGLYAHNFVFWTTDLKLVVAKTFVCCQPYDLASCFALFTNFSTTFILIRRVEQHFQSKYKAYSESTYGSKGADISKARDEMFRQLSAELMNLSRVQFMITVVVYLLAMVFLPRLGVSSMALRIYPCMAAGYFVLFMMYAELTFLYYFSDLTGVLLTALVFCVMTVLGSIAATSLPVLWYAAGILIGSLSGWIFGYFRLRYMERHMDAHMFCRGKLLKHGVGKKPSSMVFSREAKPAVKETVEKIPVASKV